MRSCLSKITLVFAAVVVMFCTSSYASGTCAVKGCYRCAVYGGSYCSKHTCSRYNCKNLAVDGGYCSAHQKKTYAGSSSGSSYCSSHKCRYSGCVNKADGSGYCSRHHYKTELMRIKGNGKRKSGIDPAIIMCGY